MALMTCRFKPINSLEKVFFDFPEDAAPVTCGSMLKNEIFSFQLAAIGEGAGAWDKQTAQLHIDIESELKPYIQMYSVGYVPVMLPTFAFAQCDDYLSKTPGLFPDPLYPMPDGEFTVYNGQARSVWFSVEPNGAVSGDFPVTIKIHNADGQLLDTVLFQLNIINADLPETDIKNTGWFHGDCIASLHNVSLQSDEYYAIVKQYLEVYVKFGHNTILTPVFTPPLDTAPGGQRPTNQLVGVSVEKGRYSFDFTLLDKWIDLCHECGLKYFEISHMFTQWGLKHAPKIMATVNGEYQRIFGWETDSMGPEYRDFLNTFLPELVQFLKAKKILQDCLFHVSDEPHKDHIEIYKEAKSILTQHIDESQFIDALHEYNLYKTGAVRIPVVSNDHIHTFMEHGATDLWTYYCCGQIDRVANRLMAMPSYRNRVLGIQLYKNNILGFLQWGFNFWYSSLSLRVIDPYHNTDADISFPSGDAFLVYPQDQNGNIICSLRLYVFAQGMQDYRAMKLLESLAGRKAVEDLLTDFTGFDTYPRNSDYYIDLRETVNQMIRKHLN